MKLLPFVRSAFVSWSRLQMLDVCIISPETNFLDGHTKIERASKRVVLITNALPLLHIQIGLKPQMHTFILWERPTFHKYPFVIALAPTFLADVQLRAKILMAADFIQEVPRGCATINEMKIALDRLEVQSFSPGSSFLVWVMALRRFHYRH